MSNNFTSNNKKRNDIYIGIMSGTSLDGVDIVAVSFQPNFSILASHSYEMPLDLKSLILELCSTSTDEIEKLGHLDVALGKLFAHCCNAFLQDYKTLISSSDITAIGLHGQTIRHRPENSNKNNFTLQIGDANVVAEDTGLITVADFRRRDIAAGGQGAPLVPMFHQSIFSTEFADRVILNIGGMSNVTLLPKSVDKSILGFDTGPGNVLLDAWIHQQKGYSYDKKGQWGRSGNINKQLLKKLLSLDFFHQPIPKSTGREQFNLNWLMQHINALDGNISDHDIQATLTELTVISISTEIKQQGYDHAEIFVCGGGAHNLYMLERLQTHLPNAQKVTTTSALNLDPDWVEASAFAWLAKQTLTGLTGNSPEVTGAKGSRILGAIYQA